MNIGQIEKLRELAIAATAGPWTIEGPSKPVVDVPDGGDYAILDSRGGLFAETFRQLASNAFRNAESNAKFIAAANPKAILDLLDQFEQYKKDAERYQYLKSLPWEIQESAEQLANWSVDFSGLYGMQAFEVNVDCAIDRMIENENK